MKYLILCCAFLAVFSCKKNTAEPPAVPELPAVTQTGANTFGCKINGVLYILNRKTSGFDPNGIDCASFLTQNQLYISASNVLSLNTPWAGRAGTFEMNDQYPYHGYYWDKSNGTAVTGGNEYKTNSLNKGAVTVTFFNGIIISGTFWFDGANDSGKIVHVTDGRFDITL